MKNMTVYVVSTAFIPPGAEGVWKYEEVGPSVVKDFIDYCKEKTKSFCGHPATARFLEVEVNRGEIGALAPGDVLVGLRPLRRINPGEEVDVTPDTFVGFILKYEGRSQNDRRE